MLTYLVFDENFIEVLLGRECDRYYIAGTTISRILLHLKVPILKFVLYVPPHHEMLLEAGDINHWLMLLSTKGMKDFSLTIMHETPLKLPTHLFSCLELTHLRLCNCCFHPPPTFRCFPNLLSLELYRMTFVSWKCGEIITQSPLLEILKISYSVSIALKLSEFTKLKNLKILHATLGQLDYPIYIGTECLSSSFFSQLGVYLPKLQELNLDFRSHEFYGGDWHVKWTGTAFPSLKTLTLCSINVTCGISLSFALELIWRSPNLQILKISATHEEAYPVPVLSFCPPDNVGHKRMRELQLQQVVLEDVIGVENEVCLIKSLLASSPLLKKMVIHADSSKVLGGDNGKMVFATKLLKLHRASALAEVDLCWF